MSAWYSNRKGFSIERLAALAAVAEHGGIMNAAGGEPTRQSQLSRQMKELEAFFGFDLLDRTSTPHQVNEAGRQIAQHTEVFLGSMMRSMDHYTHERPSISIAAGESIIQWFLIPMLAKSLTQKNSPRVRFLNQTSSQTVDRLVSGLVDIGVIKESDRRGNLAFESIGSHYPDALYHPDYFDFGNKPTWESLVDKPLAVQDHRGSLRVTMERLGGELDSSPRVIAECTSYPQVLELVMNGSCIGILPRLARKHAEDKGCKWMGLKEFKDQKTTIGVAWNKDRAKNSAGIATVLRWFGVR